LLYICTHEQDFRIFFGLHFKNTIPAHFLCKMSFLHNPVPKGKPHKPRLVQ
jgi:hypothetical protein